MCVKTPNQKSATIASELPPRRRAQQRLQKQPEHGERNALQQRVHPHHAAPAHADRVGREQHGDDEPGSRASGHQPTEPVGEVDRQRAGEHAQQTERQQIAGNCRCRVPISGAMM